MRDSNSKEIDLTDLQIHLGSRISIFVHWSKNDMISNHDKELINSLALEFDQVFVICNLNKTQSIDNGTTHNFGKNVKLINRVNSGYDFGAYQAGLAILKPIANLIDEILLMNNSVYRVHDSLNPLMTRVRNSGFDVTAITNSREKGLHLQSYFLHLKKTVLSKNEFWNWFENLEVSDSRFVTIDKLEIPFAQIIESFELSSGALWDFDSLFNFYFSSAASSLLLDFRSEWGWFVGSKEFLAGKMLNPTHYMWPHLLELGCPFLKKDLFRNKDLNLGDSKVEVVVVFDSDSKIKYLKKLKKLENEKFSISFVSYDPPFNFAKKCNLGAESATGEVVLFLNDDTLWLDPIALLELAGSAMIENVGAVGAKLLFENGRIQHAGYILREGFVGHAYIKDIDGFGPFGDLVSTHEVVGVTGACLAQRREIWESIGKWNEDFPASYNDVDYCFRITAAGFSILQVNQAKLKHFESVTRNPRVHPRERKMIEQLWGHKFAEEPYFRMAVTKPEMRTVHGNMLIRYATYARATYRRQGMLGLWGLVFNVARKTLLAKSES